MELFLVIYQITCLLFTLFCNLEDSKEYNNQENNDNIESDFKRIINNKNINSLINEIKNISWTNVLTNTNPEGAFNEFSNLNNLQQFMKTIFRLGRSHVKIK
jgi:hypothetical protein